MNAAETVTGWRLFTGLVHHALGVTLAPPLAAPTICHRRGVYMLADDDPAWGWITSLEEPLTATCWVVDHQAPAEDCSCGWRLLTDVDELAPYLRLLDRRASGHSWYGGYEVLARVEATGKVRRVEGAVFGDGTRDDPPSTMRAERLRVTGLFLAQSTHDNPGYGTAEAWRERFPSVEVMVPPPPKQLTYGTERLGIEQWVRWAAKEWGRTHG